MRPTTILGTAAALCLATIALSADAQSNPPAPTIAVSSGTITITANGTTHVNSGFPWKVLDSTGTKVKQLSDFSFPTATTATVSGAPATGTLRGGYCQDSGCYTFTASCTATACSITGT